MVFTSIVNFVRSRGPDEFWRKRKIFKLSSVRKKKNQNYLSAPFKHNYFNISAFYRKKT